MAVRFTTGKSPTQITPVPVSTKLLDPNTPTGVSMPWLKHFQAVQAQQPFNPTFVAASLSPLTVDAIHNVLFITTGGGFIVQLGPAKSSPFSMYLIVNADGGGITIRPNGTDTINGAGPIVQTAAIWRTTILVPDLKSNWLAFSIAGGG
jgi:hypothetical protein